MKSFGELNGWTEQEQIIPITYNYLRKGKMCCFMMKLSKSSKNEYDEIREVTEMKRGWAKSEDWKERWKQETVRFARFFFLIQKK